MREGIPFSCFLLMSVNLGGGRQIIWNIAAIFRVLSSKKHPKNGHIPEISSFFTYLSKFRVFCLDLLATLLELEFDLSWRLFYPVLKYTIQYYKPWTKPYLPYAILLYTTHLPILNSLDSQVHIVMPAVYMHPWIITHPWIYKLQEIF